MTNRLRSGRRTRVKVSPFLPLPKPSKEIISEATKLLTFCCVFGKIASEMPTTNDIVVALKQRLAHEQARTLEARTEMEKLADSYNRYLDLIAEVEERRKRIERIAGVLGTGHFSWVSTFAVGKGESIKYPVKEIEASAEELRRNLALWEAIEQFLMHAKESRVGEIQSFMEAVGMGTVSRQAIESAVRAHPKVFRTIKRGAERHISLKNKG